MAAPDRRGAVVGDPREREHGGGGRALPGLAERHLAWRDAATRRPKALHEATQERRAACEPEQVLLSEAGEAEPTTPWRNRPAPGETERSAIGEAKRLVEAEDGEVAVRADRLA